MSISRPIARYVAARRGRQWNLRTLGPNESRILFDAVCSYASLGFALLFCAFFVARPSPPFALASLLLPVVQIALNFFFGIYTRLRTASGETKGLVLAAAVVLTAALGYALAPRPPVVLLWAALTVGPVVLSRLLLNLQYGPNKALKAALNVGGPIVVIGGAGYIGTHAVEQLLKSGYRVRVLDRLMYGDASLREFVRNPKFEFVEGDASDIARLTFALRDAYGVVHLAGLVGDPACAVDREFTRHANIVVTHMVKEVAQAMGVQRFIFASSCSVYGASDEPVSESAATSPVSLYAQTKIDSETELLSNVSDNFFVTVLRFATVFGHSRRPRFDLVANLFTAQAFADGLITVVGPGQHRPFVHVRDVARAIVTTLRADELLVQSQTFNVGDDRMNMTILELAEQVQKIVGGEKPIAMTIADDPADRRNYEVSFDKIRDLLAFEATVSVEEGVAEMLAAFERGEYADYRQESYSNVAMTRHALDRFNDPDQLAQIYAPLSAKRHHADVGSEP